MFMGYMYMPDKSAETIDDDGMYVHTCVFFAKLNDYDYVSAM